VIRSDPAAEFLRTIREFSAAPPQAPRGGENFVSTKINTGGGQ
jgi:hypothetical protein